MYKIFSYLILAALSLSACKAVDERERIYRADYYNYSCPQLHQKYVWVRDRYDHAYRTRMALNTANGVVEVFEPNNRRIRHHYPSYEEGDYAIHMRAIENVAVDRRCEGVGF